LPFYLAEALKALTDTMIVSELIREEIPIAKLVDAFLGLIV